MANVMALQQGDRSYQNPIIPGWNSDPSCIFVSQLDNTFFCVTSSFSLFPGLPLYASKDLIHWKLICNVINRPDQVPEIGSATTQDEGIFAPTIRYHESKFYVIVQYVKIAGGPTGFGLVFTSSDPYSSQSWSNPTIFREPQGILDPDLFWDDDGQLYVQAGSFSQTIVQFQMDLHTGKTGPVREIWKGTGGIAPEGPHIYKKDGYYYLLIAEGGTDLPHCVTIARASSPEGPYIGYDEGNPILTNRDTREYFQTVGHADLFRDGHGHWWGVALATRSGPEYRHYPMGRETILFPVSWPRNGWPACASIRQTMRSESLLTSSLDVPGQGTWCHGNDQPQFRVGTGLPPHLVHWRFPPEDSISISGHGHNELQLRPSRQRLTGWHDEHQQAPGLTMVARRQTSIAFDFTFQVEEPSSWSDAAEIGITAFNNEWQNISISLVFSGQADNPTEKLGLAGHCVKLEIAGKGASQPQQSVKSVTIQPEWGWTWPLVFGVQAVDELEYKLVISPTRNMGQVTQSIVETVSTDIVSGGVGRWTGCVLGAYAVRGDGKSAPDVFSITTWSYGNND